MATIRKIKCKGCGKIMTAYAKVSDVASWDLLGNKVDAEIPSKSIVDSPCKHHN